jgi:hypothetical protein
VGEASYFVEVLGSVLLLVFTFPYLVQVEVVEGHTAVHRNLFMIARKLVV